MKVDRLELQILRLAKSSFFTTLGINSKCSALIERDE